MSLTSPLVAESMGKLFPSFDWILSRNLPNPRPPSVTRIRAPNGFEAQLALREDDAEAADAEKKAAARKMSASESDLVPITAGNGTSFWTLVRTPGVILLGPGLY